MRVKSKKIGYAVATMGMGLGLLLAGGSEVAYATEVDSYDSLVSNLAAGETDIEFTNSIFLEDDIYLDSGVTINGNGNTLYAGNHQINASYVMDNSPSISLENLDIFNATNRAFLEANDLGEDAVINLENVVYDGTGAAVSAKNATVNILGKGNNLMPDYTSDYVVYVLSANTINFASGSKSQIGFMRASKLIELKAGSKVSVETTSSSPYYPVHCDGSIRVAGSGTIFEFNGVQGGVEVPNGSFTVSGGANVVMNSNGSKIPSGQARSLLYAKSVSVQGSNPSNIGTNGKLTLNANGTSSSLSCIGLNANGIIDINGGGFDFKTERKTSPIIMRQAGTSIMRIRNGSTAVQGWSTIANVNATTSTKNWRFDAGKGKFEANITFYSAAGAGVPYDTGISSSTSTTFKNEFKVKNYARISNMRFVK